MSLELPEEGAAEEAGAPAWMATFGDLMSLLLTFFILILSFANMDVIKFSAAVGSLRDAFGTQQLDPGNHEALSTAVVEVQGRESSRQVRVIERRRRTRQAEADLRRRLQLLIARHDLEKLADAERTDRGVTVRLRADLLFGPGSADLRPEALTVLDELAVLVRASEQEVAIQGHTDDVPIRSEAFPSNWHLSTGRAIAALQYLVEVSRVAPERLSAAGYAHWRPLVPHDAPEAATQNRRVELLFLRPELPSAAAHPAAPAS